MNKTIITLTLLMTAAMAGCISDDDTVQTHQGVMQPTPSYADSTPESVVGLQFITQVLNADGEQLARGAGIWAFGDFVFGSGLTSRFWIVDVSDPEHPVVVYEAPEEVRTPYGRDADLIVHEDGRRTLALATQFDGMHFWDVTDPTMPEHLSVALFDPESDSNPPAHNLAVIPNTTYVFNSQSGGEGRTNDLVDASDPANPIDLGAFGTHGCHDITFFGSHGSDKFRAYCAGIQHTEIWDMDGFDPAADDFGIEVIVTVGCESPPDPVDQGASVEVANTAEAVSDCATNSPFVGNPAFGGGVGPIGTNARTLHHLAMVNEDASVLIIGDEYNGGGSPGACYYYDENTGRSTPLGALWFYDLSDETAPTVMSWITPPTESANTPNPDAEDADPTDPTEPVLGNVPNCTAHFGSLVPGEEKLVMAWYSAGVILIDFSDPESPVLMHQLKSEGTNPWDARIHGGYVFTGDIGRGMDVLRLV